MGDRVEANREIELSAGSISYQDTGGEGPVIEMELIFMPRAEALNFTAQALVPIASESKSRVGLKECERTYRNCI